MIKWIFHILNIVVIILYLYPGSIAGYLIYHNFSKQPQITADLLVSSNHVYAFLLLSVIGIISYYNSKNGFLINYRYIQNFNRFQGLIHIKSFYLPSLSAIHEVYLSASL